MKYIAAGGVSLLCLPEQFAQHIHSHCNSSSSGINNLASFKLSKRKKILVSIVKADDLVIKHQAVSINNIDSIQSVPVQFHKNDCFSFSLNKIRITKIRFERKFELGIPKSRGATYIRGAIDIREKTVVVNGLIRLHLYEFQVLADDMFVMMTPWYFAVSLYQSFIVGIYNIGDLKQDCGISIYRRCHSLGLSHWLLSCVYLLCLCASMLLCVNSMVLCKYL